MISPTADITTRAYESQIILDASGRRVTIRLPTALDKLRLLKAAGPELAMNQPWLSMAMLAASVLAIDDVPVPRPTTEAQIESLVDRLGDEGLDAIADVFGRLPATDEQAQNAGNSSGTPS